MHWRGRRGALGGKDDDKEEQGLVAAIGICGFLLIVFDCTHGNEIGYHTGLGSGIC